MEDGGFVFGISFHAIEFTAHWMIGGGGFALGDFLERAEIVGCGDEGFREFGFVFEIFAKIADLETGNIINNDRFVQKIATTLLRHKKQQLIIDGRNNSSLPLNIKHKIIVHPNLMTEKA